MHFPLHSKKGSYFSGLIMRYTFIFFSTLIFSNAAFAQQTANDSLQLNTDSIHLNWVYAATIFQYIFPNEKNTTSLIATADNNAWHIEARYNYEATKTGSVFGGYHFKTGNKLVLDITPMFGFAFGNVNGVVPGLETSLTWNNFDFYSESEYVFDFEGKENNFFYNWSELGITAFDKLRTGISVNRTRLFQSDLEFQKGIFAQYSFWKLTAGVFYFNPFSTDYYLIATLGIEF
ncbi:MAG TPA: hypothetical protein VNS50_08895 [Ginsengibacter sp.]|nr:hypothetical protein [Ginsengibacter sp.]